ncbi:MAG: YceI family protein [Saprospiraceae bacterium]
MILKKTLQLSLLIIMIFSFSCEQSGKKVESTEAKLVTENKTKRTTKYNKIKHGSTINWTATHLGGLDPREGKIYLEKATISVENKQVVNANIVIEMDSMTVDNIPEDGAKELVDHLKTADFFDIKKYPTSKFELTKSELIKDEYDYKFTGNLTILGVSKSISFKSNINISENEVSIKSEKFIINRADWGMTYNAKGTAGVPLDYLISDDVGFQIDVVISR